MTTSSFSSSAPPAATDRIDEPCGSSAITLSHLRRISLLKELDEAQLQSIRNYFVKTVYDKETVIFHEQDVPSQSGSRIYFVLDGYVKLVKYSSDGETTIVRLASAGEFFGVTGALTHQPYPFSAEAIKDTVILYLSDENFKRLVTQFPQIALNMICAMGEVLWFNYATHNHVIKKSEARVATIILYHLKRDGFEETAEGQRLRIRLPHEYISSMTGIAYEESVRIISRLKKQYQCIQYLRGGTILVTNLNALRWAAQDEVSLGC